MSKQEEKLKLRPLSGRQVGLWVEQQRQNASAKAELERSAMPSTWAAVQAQGNTITSMGARLVGADEFADRRNIRADAYRQGAAQLEGDGWGGTIKGAARSVFESAPPSIVGAAVAGAPGAIGYAAASEANQAITAGRQAGLEGKELAAYVGAKAGNEILWASAFNAMGLGGTEKYLGEAFKSAARAPRDAVRQGVRESLKQFGIQTTAEMAEEQFTETLGHNLIDAFAGVTDLSWENTYRIAQQTAIATLMQQGIVGSAGQIDQHRAKNRAAAYSETLQTPEGAEEFARNPATRGAAEHLARQDVAPTRETWAELGLPQMPREAREQLQQRVREHKERRDREPPLNLRPIDPPAPAQPQTQDQVPPVPPTGQTTPDQTPPAVSPPAAQPVTQGQPQQPVEPAPVKEPVIPPVTGWYVQWTSQGKDQWKSPRRVTGMSEDGTHVFVEGSKTGVPVEEVTQVDEDTQRTMELRGQAKREVNDWKRRARRQGGRLANATLQGLQEEVNAALKVLGLKGASDLSQDGVNRAYRAASRRAHPDSGGSKADMAKVNEAYELLKNAPATLELAKRKWEKDHQPSPQQPATTPATPVESPAPAPAPAPVQPQQPAAPQPAPSSPPTTPPPQGQAKQDAGMQPQQRQVGEWFAKKSRKWLEDAISRRPDQDSKDPQAIAEWIARGFDRNYFGDYIDSTQQSLPDAVAELLGVPKPEVAQPAPATPPVQPAPAPVEQVPAEPQAWEAFPDDIKNAPAEEIEGLLRSLGWKRSAKKPTKEQLLTELAKLMPPDRMGPKPPAKAETPPPETAAVAEEKPQPPPRPQSQTTPPPREKPQPPPRIQEQEQEQEQEQPPPREKQKIGRKQQTGKPATVTLADVRRAFPGRRITPSKEGGWHVSIGDSYVTVLPTEKIQVDWDAAERAYGRLSPAQREAAQILGSLSMTLPDGTTHSGLGVIRLLQGVATDATLRHEALHLARKIGLLSDREYQALARKHAPGEIDPETGQKWTDEGREEAVARAMEGTPEAATFWERIASMLRRMLDRLSGGRLARLTADDVQRLMQTEGFWAREGAIDNAGRVTPETIRDGTVTPEDAKFSLRIPDAVRRIADDKDSQWLSPNKVLISKLYESGDWGMSLEEFKQELLRMHKADELTLSRADLISAADKAKLAEVNKSSIDDKFHVVRVDSLPKYAMRRARPDLANPGLDQPTRDRVDDVDQARNEAGAPKRVTDEEINRKADKYLEKHYAKALETLARKGRDGEQLTHLETVMAQKILTQEHQKALKSGDPAAIARVIDLMWGYRETGSSQARSFRARRDPIESPAERHARLIGEALLEPPPKISRQIEQAKEQAATAEKEGRTEDAAKHRARAEEATAEWAKQVVVIGEQLKGHGIDLYSPFAGGYSERKAIHVQRAIAHAKASYWDKAHEWWSNSILSAITTQTANLAGTLHAGYELTAQRLIEATINTTLRRPEGAQLGEFKHVLAGVGPGLSRGARNFLKSWSTELPALEIELGRKSVSKIEEPRTAIAGTKGRIIRIPWRLLGAADSFMKSLFIEMEVGSRAYRIAKAEGRKGQSLQKRIAELHADPTSPAWEQAYQSALKLVFQQEGSPAGQAVKDVALRARRLWGVRYFIPFVSTLVNIFEVGIRKSPIGFATSMNKMYSNYRDGRPTFEGMSERLAENAVMLAWMLALLANDEDDPWITGAEKARTARGREEGYRTFPPNSVKIGGKWVSYERLEPFATAIALSVDLMNALRSGNLQDFGNRSAAGVLGQIQTKTFAEGIGTILSAIDAEEPVEEIARWGSDFTVSWIPNIVRSVSRERGDTYSERRIWGTGEDWYRMLAQRTAQKTEFGLIEDLPKYDAWGREARRSEVPAINDWLYRILVPMRVQKDEVFTADRLIVNYNAANPEAATFPMAPRPEYTLGGEKKYMTPEQYADYARLAGESARLALSDKSLVPLDPDKPSAAAVEWIKDVVSEARTLTRDALIEQWHGEGAGPDTEQIARAAQMRVAKAWTGSRQPKPKDGEGRAAYVERATKWLEQQKGRGEFLGGGG